MGLRILFSSNAIFVNSGYGVQAKHLLPRFIELGHDVAQFAWYGLQGAAIMSGNLRIYPGFRDPWGNDIISAHVKHFKADVLISLMDNWVLPENYNELVKPAKWVTYFPVDHSPIPDKVLARSKTADYPVVYAKFGQEECTKAGFDTTYIPHGVNTKVYTTGDKRKAREGLAIPEDAFLCSMVAANKGIPSRKGIPENLRAFATFRKAHPELNAMLYLHMNRDPVDGGVDMLELMASLDIPKDCVMFADQYLMALGLPEEYLAAIYQATDVLLAGGMGEGFGIPIIEAQSCGTPVITTNFSSMPELTFNGITVDGLQPFWTPLNSWQQTPNAQGIYEAIEAIRARTPQEAEAKKRLGVETVRREYDWDMVVANYWRPFLERVEADIRNAPAQNNGHVPQLELLPAG